MKLTLFKEIDFLNAVKALFNELKVPVNYVTDEPTTAKEILKDTYKENSTLNLIDDVYIVGMVDDAAFDGNKSLAAEKIKSDYDGRITLHQKWTDPNNEVVKRMGMFKEKSPDILKVIMES
jgi:hypothetical protein